MKSGSEGLGSKPYCVAKTTGWLGSFEQKTDCEIAVYEVTNRLPPPRIRFFEQDFLESLQPVGEPWASKERRGAQTKSNPELASSDLHEPSPAIKCRGRTLGASSTITIHSVSRCLDEAMQLTEVMSLTLLVAIFKSNFFEVVRSSNGKNPALPITCSKPLPDMDEINLLSGSLRQ